LKKILILYPHFPPSNLAGVHRARLFAQHLPSFGWEPVLLTVHENFYEEKLDHNLIKLLPKNLRIEKVNAYSIGKFRIVGDIGLRGFFQLYKKAKQLITEEHFDFLYIPIPSFYCALLGRWLHQSTGIKYGIDYIDPWVHTFPGSEKIFTRHWFSTMIAKILEPIAVKNASLITGVAEGYYKPVLDRSPHLKKVVTGAMPYGGEAGDHEIVDSLNIIPYLFTKNSNKFQFVYAGAMLPKAYNPLEKIFEVIANERNNFKEVEFHFIGTGKKTDDEIGYNIKQLAEKFKLWNSIVFEYPKRIPYLDVLVHLNIADAVFILGSTEPHYTPSKTFQAVLSQKPIFAVIHSNSTAVSIIRDSNAGKVLDFDGENGLSDINKNFSIEINQFFEFAKHFTASKVSMEKFAEFSASAVTSRLAELLDMTFLKPLGNFKKNNAKS
jgi:hypothetical protein